MFKSLNEIFSAGEPQFRQRHRKYTHSAFEQRIPFLKLWVVFYGITSIIQKIVSGSQSSDIMGLSVIATVIWCVAVLFISILQMLCLRRRNNTYTNYLLWEGLAFVSCMGRIIGTTYEYSYSQNQLYPIEESIPIFLEISNYMILTLKPFTRCVFLLIANLVYIATHGNALHLDESLRDFNIFYSSVTLNISFLILSYSLTRLEKKFFGNLRDLQDQNLILTTIMKALPQGIAILDKDCKFKFTNSVFCSMFDEQEMLDQAVREVTMRSKIANPERAVNSKNDGYLPDTPPNNHYDTVVSPQANSNFSNFSNFSSARALLSKHGLVSRLASKANSINIPAANSNNISTFRSLMDESLQPNGIGSREPGLANSIFSSNNTDLMNGQSPVASQMIAYNNLSTGQLPIIIEKSPLAEEKKSSSSSSDSKIPQEESSVSNLKNLRSLFNMVASRELENSEESPETLIFDSKFKDRCIEIRVTRASHQNEEVIIAIFTDITDQKQISQLNDRNEFKDNLLASFSHELKTPLNSSLLLLNNVMSSLSPTNELLPSLQSAYTSQKRLDIIIDGILDVSLLNSNRFRLNIEPFTIDSILRELDDLIGSVARKKGLVYTTNVKGNSKMQLRSDPRRFVQVLFNLLDNAIKFTFSGQIKLSIKQDPLKTRFIKVKIKDTGVGMSAKQQEKLRETLQNDKIGYKLTPNSTGGGLGLYISNLISGKLGRNLRFASVQGRGSAFEFCIKNFEPVLKSNEITSLQESKLLDPSIYIKEHPETVFTEMGSIFEEDVPRQDISEFNNKLENFTLMLVENNSGKRVGPKQDPSESPRLIRTLPRACSHPEILIADDDAFNVISLSNVISKLGYSCAKSYNGEAALKIFKNFWENEYIKCQGPCSGFKLVLLDCNMPKMDGFECMQRMRVLMDEGKAKRVPIIACTSFVNPEEKDRCLSMGFDHFLSKPLDVNKLSDLFEKYLKSVIPRVRTTTSINFEHL